MSLLPFLILLVLMALSVLALFIWRKAVARNEDDQLHVLAAGSPQTAQQAAVAQKLELIDKWGKILTIVTVVFGLIVGGLYLWQSWIQNTTTGV